MNEKLPKPISNKKLMIPFIVIILLAIIVAGVLLLSNSSSGADTKITSVDINKNLPNFTVTVHLKNVGDKGDTISVKAYLFSIGSSDWAWYTEDFETKTIGYIDSGDTGTATFNFQILRNRDMVDKYKIVVVAESPSIEGSKNRELDSGDARFTFSFHGTDIYTEEFFK
jgi:hypothetical protein